MSAYLLLPLLFIAALGLALGLQWARYPSNSRMHWYAVLALLLALSALEFFLLSSQLALLIPVVALIGLPLPLLLGPLWWRAGNARPCWSTRRWMVALVPAAVMCTLCALGLVFVGVDVLLSSGALPAQILVFASVLTALMSRPQSAQSAARRTDRRSIYARN